ncbi:hypothetical protein C8R45DRAFT_1103639 [Mycena sanguinolenta]|nr:hypothetical protein C8R45DRAFT_1103639 [Mycena sanguinolenta]
MSRKRNPRRQSNLGQLGTCHQHNFSVDELEGPVNVPVPAFVHRVSEDRRRVYVKELAVEPPSPLKRLRREAVETEEAPPVPILFAPFEESSMDSERYQLGLFDDEEPISAPHLAPKPRTVKPFKPSDPSLSEWRAKRDAYLTALMRRDGPGDDGLSATLCCPACRTQTPEYRCRDCFEPARAGFVTLPINGIHEVQVDFCGCERAQDAGPPEIQLLRVGWFPATHERPQTCATLTVLEKFHQDTLQSKMTMYDFYGVLEKLTDNTGIEPPDHYHKWIRMCREFQHLMLLKRGGRAVAYAPSGVGGTQQGELAIECPACLRPNVNLPAGWEDVSLEDQFLYTLFIALDACFRLKRRLVSSELKDPDLGSGWAYMVDTDPYREYLRGVTTQKEMNTCSGLAALDHANTKFSRGYSTTGVAMGVCGRHEFVQPNGVGDLQRGERFSNVDYVLACILRLKDTRLRKLLTYDIACIWAIHLLERLKKLPPHVRLIIVLAFVRFAIPKMHIQGHTLLCQLLYSLNILLGSGQLDAEGIERAWAGIGGVAASTRDMGPGARHDVLDCQWSHWNWQKLVGIIELLRRRLDRAKEELAEQTEALEEFSTQQADRVPEWRRLVVEFEHDPKNKKNPYEIEVQGLSEAQVRLQFTTEEAEEAARGVPSLHDVSPGAFIAAGLDLEEEQRRINLAGMRTKLNRGIARFWKIQRAYMPVAVQLLGDMALPPTMLAEDVPLLLPSALTEAQRARCAGGLDHGVNTKSWTIVTRNESKICLHSEKYQTAWEAVRKLSGGDEDLVGWRVLKREDIRCMEDQEDLRKKAKAQAAREAKRRTKNSELRTHGMLPAEEDDDMEWEADGDTGRGPENQRQVSWIWVVAGTEGTDAGLENGLRVEWSKAFALTRRWGEEVRLLEEEFRRICISFDHESGKW